MLIFVGAPHSLLKCKPAIAMTRGYKNFHGKVLVREQLHLSQIAPAHMIFRPRTNKNMRRISSKPQADVFLHSDPINRARDGRELIVGTEKWCGEPTSPPFVHGHRSF